MSVSGLGQDNKKLCRAEFHWLPGNMTLYLSSMVLFNMCSFVTVKATDRNCGLSSLKHIQLFQGQTKKERNIIKGHDGVMKIWI